MADRYWVGGTASWDGTAGTKWATTSGGAGGASVPTSADDVFFSNLSTGTCTIATGNTGAKSINCTGFTGTLAGSAAITVAGSVTLATGMTFSYSGTMTVTGTGSHTITSAGKTFSPLTINSSGGTYTLADAYSTSTARNVTLQSGTFDTANYNFSAGALLTSGSSAKTISFGSSTVTLSSTGTFINLNATNVTFNAGTSQINASGTSGTLQGGGKTFYNLSFTASTAASVYTINGANTFNNLTFPSRFSTGTIMSIVLGADQTVSDTLTIPTSTNATSRVKIVPDNAAQTRTLTIATFASTADVDFMNITVSGAASPITGTRFGDAGGNSGVTFASASNKYWNLNAGGSWSATAWATTSGGTPAANNFPLPQDTCYIEATGLNSGVNITIDASWLVGTVDLSARTANTVTINSLSTPILFLVGSLILGSGVTMGLTNAIRFFGPNSKNLTSAGKSLGAFIIDGGTLTLQDGLTNVNTATLTSGTLDTANYSLTATSFASSGTETRALNLGSSTVTLSGTGTVWNLTPSTGMTLSPGTSTIVLSSTTTGSRTFNGGGLTYNNFTIGGATGTSVLTITGSNTFNTFASTKTVAHTIRFTSGTTNTFTSWTVTGTAGNVVTVGATSTSQATIAKATSWYVGANSTNGGNNSNLIFTAGDGIDYLSLSYINGSPATAVSTSTTDTSTASDVVFATVSFQRFVQETSTVLDSFSSKTLFQASIIETGAATDSIDSFRGYLASISEFASAADVVYALQSFAASVVDSASAVESVFAKQTSESTVSETASILDDVQRSVAFFSEISEIASASDVLIAAKTYLAAIADGASIVDAVAVAASTFNATAADTATGTDSVLARATFRSSTTDTADGTDTVASSLVVNPVILESGTGTDTFAAKQFFSTQILEAGAGADTFAVAPSVFNAPVVEISTIADTSVVAPSVFNAPVVETVVLTEALIGAFLWNLIDDAQTPDWQNISTTQSVTWTLVDDSQNPNWQNINTLN